MSSLRSVELTFIDDVYRGDDRGYVRGFSDRNRSCVAIARKSARC